MVTRLTKNNNSNNTVTEMLVEPPGQGCLVLPLWKLAVKQTLLRLRPLCTGLLFHQFFIPTVRSCTYQYVRYTYLVPFFAKQYLCGLTTEYFSEIQQYRLNIQIFISTFIIS